MKKSEVADRVTDYTFSAVDDLASHANDLEGIGFKREAEKLRRIAGDLENVSITIMERIKKGGNQREKGQRRV